MNQIFVVIWALLDKFIFENLVSISGQFQKEIKNIQFCRFIFFFHLYDIWIYVTDIG